MSVFLPASSSAGVCRASAMASACVLPSSSWTDSSVSPEPLASEAVVVSRGASVSVDVVAEASNPPEASPSASASCDQAGADTKRQLTRMELATKEGAEGEVGVTGALATPRRRLPSSKADIFMEQLRVNVSGFARSKGNYLSVPGWTRTDVFKSLSGAELGPTDSSIVPPSITQCLASSSQ